MLHDTAKSNLRRKFVTSETDSNYRVTKMTFDAVSEKLSERFLKGLKFLNDSLVVAKRTIVLE
jgi:hypothetical protein